jgi:hypothetical protein
MRGGRFTVPPAGNYILGRVDALYQDGIINSGHSMFYFDPAEHAISGRLTKLRIACLLASGDVALGATYTFQLRRLTLAGPANVNLTLGAVLASAAVVNPAAATPIRALSAEIAAPSAGYLALAVNASANAPASSALTTNGCVQVRNR